MGALSAGSIAVSAIGKGYAAFVALRALRGAGKMRTKSDEGMPQGRYPNPTDPSMAIRRPD